MSLIRLTIFNPAIIKDFNIEGYENVESEDFDAGFGCVPIEEVKVLNPPPPVPDNRTANDRENEKYFFMTADEKDQANDEHLKRCGL